MNSEGDITMCVVPSCRSDFNFGTAWPAEVHCARSLATAGRPM